MNILAKIEANDPATSRLRFLIVTDTQDEIETDFERISFVNEE